LSFVLKRAALLFFLFMRRNILANGWRNGCRGRIVDMTVPEALRVDTDGGHQTGHGVPCAVSGCKFERYRNFLFAAAVLVLFGVFFGAHCIQTHG
jgi:hypothetical protein